jgi:Tfp pilus assembly protein PilZ
MRVRDLSTSGLRLEGPLPLGFGESVFLDLHLPDDPVAVKALVDVVWSQPARDQSQPHRCGMRFAAIDEEGIRRIKNFLVQVPIELS